MTDAIKDGKRIPLGKYGCFDRKPFLPALMVQSGWTEDGRRKMVQIPFVMSTNCKTDIPDDQRCQGCKWRKE